MCFKIICIISEILVNHECQSFRICVFLCFSYFMIAVANIFMWSVTLFTGGRPSHDRSAAVLCWVRQQPDPRATADIAGVVHPWHVPAETQRHGELAQRCCQQAAQPLLLQRRHQGGKGGWHIVLLLSSGQACRGFWTEIAPSLPGSCFLQGREDSQRWFHLLHAGSRCHTPMLHFSWQAKPCEVWCLHCTTGQTSCLTQAAARAEEVHMWPNRQVYSQPGSTGQVDWTPWLVETTSQEKDCPSWNLKLPRMLLFVGCLMS